MAAAMANLQSFAMVNHITNLLGIPRVSLNHRSLVLLGDEFSYRDLGQIDVKGKGELQAYSVTDENRSFPQ